MPRKFPSPVKAIIILYTVQTYTVVIFRWAEHKGQWIFPDQESANGRGQLNLLFSKNIIYLHAMRFWYSVQFLPYFSLKVEKCNSPVLLLNVGLKAGFIGKNL